MEEQVKQETTIMEETSRLEDPGGAPLGKVIGAVLTVEGR